MGVGPTMWVTVRQSGCWGEGEGVGWGSVLRSGSRSGRVGVGVRVRG